ncbi:DUF317 domain-containing protein [Streptomyces sp. NPDC054933]
MPRHLAGHQPEKGPALATSPCLRLWAGLVPEPDTPGKGKWTIAANRVPFAPPTWQITFDATTPIELLHDVHTELLDLYLEDRHSDRDWLFEDDTAPQEAYTPLLARGWSHQVNTDGTQLFGSPEGLGGVRPGTPPPVSTRPSGWPGAAMPASRTGETRTSPSVRPPRLSRPSPPRSSPPSRSGRTVKDVSFHSRRLLYVAADAMTAKQAHLSSPVATPPPGPAPSRNR